MTVKYLASFQQDFVHLPQPTQKKFQRQLHTLLRAGMTYPGLNVRKMGGHVGIWEARIDRHYRFTYQTLGDVILLRRIGTHAIYRKP